MKNVKRRNVWRNLILVLLASCTTGCGKFGSENVKKIGIIQVAEHESLDAARRGFIDGLDELELKNGENIKIDYKNAQGDQSILNQIAAKFVGDRKDLILAIATPAAESAASATKNIPIVATAITDYVASGLTSSNGTHPENITGTSDLVPIEKQISLIKDLLPEAKNVGILYSLGELNSKIQAEMAHKECEKVGLKSRDYTASQISEIGQVVESMNGKVDVIFVPTDNLMAQAMPQICKIAETLKCAVISGFPTVVCSDKNLVEYGPLATYGIDYYELGKLTATQAVEILNDDTKPQDMPILHIDEPKLVLNREIIEKLGIVVPENLDEIAEYIN
jgi:putative ABC transport system substrate-binding protein